MIKRRGEDPVAEIHEQRALCSSIDEGIDEVGFVDVRAVIECECAFVFMDAACHDWSERASF